MRSIGVLAAVTGTLLLASACSDGGGTPPPDNTAPVASFTRTCNAADCTFTSTSTDEAPGTIATYAWTFGDGGTADVMNPSHTYAVTAPTDFTVTLTVMDNEGATDVETQTVTVAPVAPVNPPPTARFTYSCIAVDCAFTSTSSDVAPGTITTHAWTFGDGAAADVLNPSHRYTTTAATDFTVTLTVTDNEGATAVATQTVSVTPAPIRPPAAGFTYSCTNVAKCSFVSTVDVTPGATATYAWTFGDGGTADVSNPTHTYAITVPTDFTVTLTVTDNVGGTAVVSQTVTASPPPPVAEGCAVSSSSPKIVECAFNIPARSTVKLKLLGISCIDRGQKVTAAPPINDQVFLSVCLRTVGEELGIFGGPLDHRIVYEVGSQLRIWLTGATPRVGEPAAGPPAATFTGTFPDWTINFEDGADPSGAGEPDFTDVVVGVHATVIP
jgi:PKD repeat protein